MRQLIIFLILILICSTGLSAENTVILKNGTNVKGKVISQDDKNLIIKLSGGNNQIISKGQILKVIYKDLSEQEAQKIRLEEEKKLRAKEEAERLKQEKQEALANKKLEEEAKKKQAAEDLKAAEEAKRNPRMSDAEWEIYREKNKQRSDAASACGSRIGLVWRSALIPGWGQLCGKNYISAALFFGSILGGAYYTETNLKSNLNSDRDKYDQLTFLNQFVGPPSKLSGQYINSSSDFSNLFLENIIINDLLSQTKNDSKKSNAIYNGGLGTVALIYLTNIFHAYWIGRDVYPERPLVMFGREIRPGLDWSANIEMPSSNTIYYDQSKVSTNAEIRYSILF